VEPRQEIHPSACIEKPCEIGAGTKIAPFCHVMAHSRLGARCNLGQNVHVAGGVQIGNNVEIQHNVALFTGLKTEDDVFLGASCVFTDIINPRSQVARGEPNEKTLVRRGATVGANATIMCGITIGQYAFIAAGAVVTRDVPDYALMMGVPARQVGWMSRHGHRLGTPDGAGIMRCPATGWRYHVADGVLRCLELREDEPLPTAAA
jgi:UDP-2-acetamido-3-amino-2,3-dideoxy-glucuronate N-acetyltransferase